MPKKLTTEGKIGKSKLFPTPEDIKKIETLIGDDGCTHIEVARCLNICKETLYKWRREYPAVREAMEAGLAKEHKSLRSVLITKALAGDTACLLFALKTRHGYRETSPVETESRVSVQVVLPGALNAADYARIIEHE